LFQVFPQILPFLLLKVFLDSRFTLLDYLHYFGLDCATTALYPASFDLISLLQTVCQIIVLYILIFEYSMRMEGKRR